MSWLVLKDIQDCIDLALDADTTKEYECRIDFTIAKESFSAYSVSISHRDLLFYCENTTLNFLIDSYDDRHMIELFNIERG